MCLPIGKWITEGWKPFLVATGMDWVAFLGTRLIIADSLWVLGQVAIATVFWVWCLRYTNRPGSLVPVVLGSVLGAYLGMRYPSHL